MATMIDMSQKQNIFHSLNKSEKTLIAYPTIKQAVKQEETLGTNAPWATNFS